MHGENVHDALRETYEEDLVVERRLGVGLLLLAAGVVQENEIEVGGVTEFDAAELALADRTDPHDAPRGAGAAHRHAELTGDLPPAGAHRLLEQQLRDIGQAIADAHQRQAA